MSIVSKKQLTKLREERGLTQKDLSDETGIGIATIKRYESESYSFKVGSRYESLEIIARYFGVYSNWIITGHGYRNHKEELKAELRANGLEEKALSFVKRIELQKKLEEVIESIYLEGFKNDLPPILKQDAAKIDFNGLSVVEWKQIEKYAAMWESMMNDIKNYMKERTTKFKSDVKIKLEEERSK